ncbi:MAG TPA: DUF748 domain-containing protein, partial [Geobacteraceae bacterium]
MTISSYRKMAAGVLLAAAIAVAAAVMLIPRLLDLDTCRNQLLSLARNALNRQVSYESAAFSWHFGPAFTFHGLVIKEKNGETSLLEADRLSFTLALLPLLHREVRLREVVLERPRLQLDRNAAGDWNIADLFAGKPGEFEFHLHALRVDRGKVRVTDRSNKAGTITVSLEAIDLSVRNPNRGETAKIKLSTILADRGGKARLNVSGTAMLPAANLPLADTSFDLAVSAEKLEVGHYWPLYARYLPFAKLRGELELSGDLKGTLTQFTSTGRLRLRGLLLDYPQAFPDPLSPGEVTLSYQLQLTPWDLTIRSLDLSVDGLHVKGSCELSDLQSADLRISARADTSPFRLEKFSQYIPYGIIPSGTAGFIQQHITGGIFQLNEGRIEGRVSHLLNLGQGDNYKALFIRGRVDQGVVALGSGIPAISGISGGLELDGKDFGLRGMKGNFGSSPLTLDGKLADYTLDTGPRYPFTMTMTPSPAEVAWLLRQETPGPFTYRGPSLLHLTGAGTADDYRLTGSWDLTRADYRYEQQLIKPADRKNQIAFSILLDKTAARLTRLDFQLPDLRLTADASYRYSDPVPLSFSAATGQTPITANLGYFPGMVKYQPSGTLQATVSGRGGPDSIRLKGAATLNGVSLRSPGQPSPITGLNGTIEFSEAGLATEQLTGWLGSTPVTVKGALTGLANPALDLEFSSPALNLTDLGFHLPDQDLLVTRLAGRISLKDDTLAIRSLSGELLHSSFTLHGDVRQLNQPDIDLQIDFPFLKEEDLETLAALEHSSADSGPPRLRKFTARVSAAAGSARDIPFTGLTANLSYAERLVTVQ